LTAPVKSNRASLLAARVRKPPAMGGKTSSTSASDPSRREMLEISDVTVVLT